MIKNKELIPLFNDLRNILKPYSKYFNSVVEVEGAYHLKSDIDIEIEGRKKKEMYFASLLIQKNYVGFYFMPVYIDTTIKNSLSPQLLSLLKGKSCFYIKKLDDQLKSDMVNALEIGLRMYKDYKWI